MNRYVILALQFANQFIGGLWLEQSSHILDTDDLGPGIHQLTSQRLVVVQRVFMLVWAEQVTRIAHRPFSNLASLPNVFNALLHLFDPVQTVKDPKDVNAIFSTLIDEFL